jgi:hypothetical protein
MEMTFAWVITAKLSFDINAIDLRRVTRGCIKLSLAYFIDL